MNKICSMILLLITLAPSAKADGPLHNTTATLNGNGSTVLITGSPAEVIFQSMTDARESYIASSGGYPLTIRMSKFIKCNLYKGDFSCGFKVNPLGTISQF